jgi:glycosyltransferase involved in cell wall biosynthesis
MSSAASLYISTWSLNEPLCQSQTVQYLRALASRGYRSCLITFERPPYLLDAEEQARATERLERVGICWHPIRYHKRASVLGAFYDGVTVFAAAAMAVARHGARIVHTRTSVPAVVGLAIATITRRPFLYDADNQLSEEYADAGYWNRSGWSFKLLAAFERLCRRHADAIVVLTEQLRRLFIAEGVTVPVAVIPCCVDVQRFRFDERHRLARRREIGVDGERLLVYCGKIGPRYLVRDMMRFAKAVDRRAGRARLLVLTHDDPEAFRTAALAEGWRPDSVIVRSADHADVHEWLSAADAGLALIKPVPSERGASPIKASEYLAAGLPVVLTPSIGDLSAEVEAHRLGVIVREGEAGSDRAVHDLEVLWGEAAATRERCAAWARSSVDADRIATERYVEAYENLLGHPGHR